jgi:hypothetical protein
MTFKREHLSRGNVVRFCELWPRVVFLKDCAGSQRMKSQSSNESLNVHSNGSWFISHCFLNWAVFFNLRIVGGGVQTGSTRHRGHLLSYCACPWWLWGWRIIRWNEDWQGKPKYSEKTCPSATLSTTNPTWSNPGRRCGEPATNRLSTGATSWAGCKAPRIQMNLSVEL